MSNYVMLLRGKETDELQEKHPNVYLLITYIARKAKRTNEVSDGYEIGECLLDDSIPIGLSRQALRTAIEKAENMRLISVSAKGRNLTLNREICRLNTKSTIKLTIRGTLVKLISSTICDINPEIINHQVGHEATIKQPSSNHQTRPTDESLLYKNVKNDKNIKTTTACLISADAFSKLMDLGISEGDLLSFDQQAKKEKFSPKRIDLAIDYILTPGFKPDSSWIGTLVWHCRSIMPPEKKDIKVDAKSYISSRYEDGKIYYGMICSLYPDCMILSHGSAQRGFVYSEKGVLDELKYYENKCLENQKGVM